MNKRSLATIAETRVLSGTCCFHARRCEACRGKTRNPLFDKQLEFLQSGHSSLPGATEYISCLESGVKPTRTPLLPNIAQTHPFRPWLAGSPHPPGWGATTHYGLLCRQSNAGQARFWALWNRSADRIQPDRVARLGSGCCRERLGVRLRLRRRNDLDLGQRPPRRTAM